MLALHYFVTRTRWGKAMRATAQDRETAQAFGIPVTRVYAAVFALGAMLAAVAGVLIVPIRQAHYLQKLAALEHSFDQLQMSATATIDAAQAATALLMRERLIAPPPAV